MTGIPALFSDVYFLAGLGLFILSAAGVFWILKSMQRERGDFDEEEDLGHPSLIRPSRAQVPSQQITPPRVVNLESLELQIRKIEETLAKIEKKLGEQDPNQMNEMAGQMKLILQMLKTALTSTGAVPGSDVGGKIEKIYQILSSLSQTEPK